MKARLFSKYGRLKGMSFEIVEEAVVGRSPECTIALQDGAISGRHARIAYDTRRGCFMVEDLDSLNGTQVDGCPVEQPEALGHLNIITFGTRDFVFQDVELCCRRHAEPARPEPAEAQVEQAVPVDSPPLADVDSEKGTRVEEGGFALPNSMADVDSGEGTRVEEGGFALPKSVADGDPGEGTRIEEGGFKLPGSMAGGGESEPVEEEHSEEDTGETPIQPDPSGVVKVAFRLEVPDLALSFTLEEGENLIGRAEDAAVRINVPDISRRHAVITVRGDKVTVRDEGSSNKTFIEDREIGGEPVELLAGDVLIFGDVKASLHRG